MKTWVILPLLAALSLGACGCEQIGFLLYLVAPEGSTKTVPAEFEDLKGRTVAVVVYADQAVNYEYPLARYELCAVISSELKERLKDVNVVDARTVVRYQNENIRWDAIDKTELARNLSCDYLLQVSLLQFTTKEPGSVNLYRGMISGQVSVYKVDLPERQCQVWSGKDVSIVYPPDAPVGQIGQDDTQIRYQSEQLFAQALVRNFYKHKVPK